MDELLHLLEVWPSGQLEGSLPMEGDSQGLLGPWVPERNIYDLLPRFKTKTKILFLFPSELLDDCVRCLGLHRRCRFLSLASFPLFPIQGPPGCPSLAYGPCPLLPSPSVSRFPAAVCYCTQYISGYVFELSHSRTVSPRILQA